MYARQGTCLRPAVQLSMILWPTLGWAQFPALLDLGDLDGSNGFVIYGIGEDYATGATTAGAGDINDDGIPDLLVGAPGSVSIPPGPTGYAYVVFGRPALGGTGVFDLLALNGANGFVIPGLRTLDYLGASLAGRTDLDRDGVDDFLVGADGANPFGRTDAGETYVFYGAVGIGSSGTLSPSTLNGANGYVVAGARALDGAGRYADSAGDFNDDGWPDIVLGAPGADPHGSDTGQVYVVYGGAEVGAVGYVDLLTLDGGNGLSINGIAAGDLAGHCAGLGDFNGDGVDDIAIGAPFADLPGLPYSGQAYVVYGRAGLTEPVLELSSLDGTNGFAINGFIPDEWLGVRVAGPGDLNDDGYKDVAVSGAETGGSVYVVFGGSAVAPGGVFALSTLDGSNGFRVPYRYTGLIPGLGGIGDLNGDGIDDLAIGILYDPELFQRVAVLFGAPDIGEGGIVDTSALNGANGFLIAGIDQGGLTGESLADAGDLNDDGVTDLVIGVPFAQPPGRPPDAGKAYVVFGRDTGDSADFDDDGDVDLNDFITFQLCFVGSNNPRAPGCARPDLDRDGDVDLADFLIFQQNFTGSL